MFGFLFVVCAILMWKQQEKENSSFFYYFHFKRIQKHIKASLLCWLLNGYYYMLCIHFITLFISYGLFFCSYFASVQQLNIFIVSLLQFISLFIFLVLNAPVDLLIRVISIIFNSFFRSFTNSFLFLFCFLIPKITIRIIHIII